MILGGFQKIDLELIQQDTPEKDIELRFDMKNIYNWRKYTNTGRTATIYLYKSCGNFKENDVILLPDYLCLTVILSATYSNLKCRFYRVDKELNIDIEDLKSKIDETVKAIYIIHYFGFPQNEQIVDELKSIRKEKNIEIIEDVTQALYSKDEKSMGFGDYVVCSIRKWLPVTDGGLLAVRDGIRYSDIELEHGYNEAAYKQILISLFRDYYDKHPEKDKTFYIELEKEANRDRYKDMTIRQMTSISKKIMAAHNAEELIKKRRENYMYLYECLKDNPNVKILGKQLDASGNYVPFGFPLLVEDRDRFNKYMIQHNIIGEIQWILPDEYYTPGKDASYLSKHNLMIQCDQSHSLKDMEYIAKIIQSF